MRIEKITEDAIVFDNGKVLDYFHLQNCCENNYADFRQLDDLAIGYDFDENLKFEKVDGCGFRFGDKNVMFFIPCYSEQNGYYSDEVEIYYDGRKVLELCAEVRLY